jgi:phosphatidylglycerophosphate synthase
MIKYLFLRSFLFFFSKRKYLLFVIYYVISGLFDSFDGGLARWLQQQSLVGQFFELILDQYAHFVIYACIGLLYPSYIVYFYLEIALELWNSLFNLYIHSLPKSDQSWLHKPTFFTTKCSVYIHDNPNLRLLNWFGPDIFHVLLIVRYILINDNERKLITKIKRYISMDKVYLIIRYTIYFTGFFSILRTYVTSCFILDKLSKMARAK